MTKAEFLEKFSHEVLQLDYVIDENSELSNTDEWDSLAHVNAIAFLDIEFNIRLKFDEIRNFNTINDIIQKVGI